MKAHEAARPASPAIPTGAARPTSAAKKNTDRTSHAITSDSAKRRQSSHAAMNAPMLGDCGEATDPTTTSSDGTGSLMSLRRTTDRRAATRCAPASTRSLRAMAHATAAGRPNA